MLHIMLMILKIVGLILLTLLGILLTVVLLLLFVPVRYRLDGSYEGKPKGKVMVSWLLHAVTAKLSFDEAAVLSVKVLWFKLFEEQLWPESEEEEESETQELTESGVLGPVEQTESGSPEPAGASGMGAQSGVDEADTADVPEPGERTAGGDLEPESVAEAKEPAKQVGEPEEGLEDILVHTTELGSEKEEEPRGPLTSAAGVFEKIRCTFRGICDKLKAGKKSYEKGRAFLENEENQKTIKLLFKQVKKLLRQLLPRKIGGRVRFGFDDPYYTGQVLTAVSPFYALYAKTLTLEPVFEEKVLEGELHIKGHIRVASLLWIGLRVLLNKNFRRLLRRCRK